MTINVNPVFTKCATCKFWAGERKIDSNMGIIVDDELLGKCENPDGKYNGTDRSSLDICDNRVVLEEINNYLSELRKDREDIPAFFTGYFGMDGISQQMMHSQEDYDDPVLDRNCDFEYDGYVTNIGKNVTIHIKKEHMSEDNINSVILWFGLKPDSVDSIKVEMI